MPLFRQSKLQKEKAATEVSPECAHGVGGICSLQLKR